MNVLHPTLWRTCRVLANPVRLRVLHDVVQRQERCVSAVARACHLPPSSATLALRALQARGLLGVRREGLFVIYFATADDGGEHAAAVLAALRRSFQRGDRPAEIKQAATAFTHPRRITIVQALAQAPTGASDLAVRCGISKPALYRHLDKLMRRGAVVSGPDDRWQLSTPHARLLQDLLALLTPCTGRNAMFARTHTP
jgi:DNA-binding transcriptional ArsR family regulator